MPVPVYVQSIDDTHEETIELIWEEMPYEWYDEIVWPEVLIEIDDQDAQRQRITIEGNPDGGTFTLSFGGNTTTELNRFIFPYEIEAALEALPSIGVGNVSVTYVEAAETPDIADRVIMDWYVDFDPGIPSPALMTADIAELIPRGSVMAKTIQMLAVPVAYVKQALLEMPPMRSADEAWDYALDGVASNVGAERLPAETDVWLREKVRFAIFLQHIDPWNPSHITKAIAWYCGIFKQNLDWRDDYLPLIKLYQNRQPFWPFEGISGIGKDLSAFMCVTFPWTLVDQWHEDMWKICGTKGDNEVQTLTLSGNPSGGTFTVTVGGQETSAIAYNADAATIQTALEALSTVDAGDITVTGSGPFTLSYAGQYEFTTVALATADGANLTGGTSPDAAITQATAGYMADFPWQANVNTNNLTYTVTHGHHLLLNLMDLADIISISGIKIRLWGYGLSLMGSRTGDFPWQANISSDRRISGPVELRRENPIDYADFAATYDHHKEPEGNLWINDNDNIPYIQKSLNLLAVGDETGKRVFRFGNKARKGGYLWP